jgi:hypothetical protein
MSVVFGFSGGLNEWEAVKFGAGTLAAVRIARPLTKHREVSIGLFDTALLLIGACWKSDNPM